MFRSDGTELNVLHIKIIINSSLYHQNVLKFIKHKLHFLITIKQFNIPRRSSL